MTSVAQVLLHPFSALRSFWRVRFDAWLNRRIQPRSRITLNQKRVFIFPTRFGGWLGVLLFSLLVGAINYENSLVFALCFLLASQFVVSVLHTFRNLSGLTIAAGRSEPVFAGEDAPFEVIFSRHGERQYEAIYAGWPDSARQLVDLVDEEEVRVCLYTRAHRRGRMRPGRLLVETFYPVGMLRAWTWLDLGMECIVYPQPLPAGPLPASAAGDEEGEHTAGSGADDYAGIREYRAGDSLRQIAWKSLARGQGLYTKEFEARLDRRQWIDWDYLPAMNTEARLSRMCFWVLELFRERGEYGLRLPGLEIAPDVGPQHRDRCLRALALYQDA